MGGVGEGRREEEKGSKMRGGIAKKRGEGKEGEGRNRNISLLHL